MKRPIARPTKQLSRSKRKSSPRNHSKWQRSVWRSYERMRQHKFSETFANGGVIQVDNSDLYACAECDKPLVNGQCLYVTCPEYGLSKP